MERRSSARLVAPRPLLRAGLERLAAGAGLEIVDGTEADLVLCCTDVLAAQPPVDVTVVVGNIIIVCRGSPDAAVWEIVRDLIRRTFAG